MSTLMPCHAVTCSEEGCCHCNRWEIWEQELTEAERQGGEYHEQPASKGEPSNFCDLQQAVKSHCSGVEAAARTGA
ncbi:UNVERIFIED_CONTAM: hypothetical protein FKN15_076244 [Acipenser sinensis]